MFETLKFIVDTIVRPDNAMAHYNLGRVLWTKGDREGAFEEFHTA
jgi:hypothetical protein